MMNKNSCSRLHEPAHQALSLPGQGKLLGAPEGLGIHTQRQAAELSSRMICTWPEHAERAGHPQPQLPAATPPWRVKTVLNMA